MSHNQSYSEVTWYSTGKGTRNITEPLHLDFELVFSRCMFRSLLLVSEVTANYTVKSKDLGKIHTKKEHAVLVFLSLGELTQFLIRSFTCEFEDFVFLPSCVYANLHYQLISWRKYRSFHSITIVSRATANMAEQLSGVRRLLLWAYIYRRVV